MTFKKPKTMLKIKTERIKIWLRQNKFWCQNQRETRRAPSPPRRNLKGTRTPNFEALFFSSNKIVVLSLSFYICILDSENPPLCVTVCMYLLIFVLCVLSIILINNLFVLLCVCIHIINADLVGVIKLHIIYVAFGASYHNWNWNWSGLCSI